MQEMASTAAELNKISDGQLQDLVSAVANSLDVSSTIAAESLPRIAPFITAGVLCAARGQLELAHMGASASWRIRIFKAVNPAFP